MCARGDGCVGVAVSLCVVVRVCRKKGRKSTSVRHKNHACPLVCEACCCAFVGEVNICGSVLFFRKSMLMPATHSFSMFQKFIEKLKSKINPEDRYNIFSQGNWWDHPQPPVENTRSRKAPHAGEVFPV